MALEDIRRDRLEKANRYEASGQDPYPATVRRNFLIGDVLKRFSQLERGRRPVALAGRLRAWREHGGATFGNLEDASGAIQIYFSRDELGEEYEALLGAVDIGDILEVSGSLFKTKRGEPTVRVSEATIAAKSIRPLPEKWHGLKDVEERFRRRYLDLIMNPDVRERFRMRARIIGAVRAFFESEGFVEVETPILQPTAGGALARPFITHHHALDIDLYLRVAPELYLKKLLVGGFERVFELGKSFRNEGIDATHNPEFTTVEWYAAYWDDEAMMECVERFFRTLAKKLKLGDSLSYDGKAIVLPPRFARMDFREALKRHALVADYDAESRDSLAERALRFGISASPQDAKERVADEIFKKVCRPHLVNPVFVTGHPRGLSPLAKASPDRADSVRRFQLIMGGLELVNAYAELNDPREQQRRFEEQSLRRSRGEDEAHPTDAAFIEALEYGMPPAAGAGIGIDRLVMLITDTKQIREVVLFPTMRPR